MITHDVDEAILLSDRILLMTNGPYAKIAESVVIVIPRPRNRTDIIHHSHYYPIRNHIVEFLVKRSKELADPALRPTEENTSSKLDYPPEVNPATGTVQEVTHPSSPADNESLEHHVVNMQ